MEKIAGRPSVTESSLITMGSLLIPISFGMLLIAASEQTSSGLAPEVRLVLAISSPLLYVWWLFAVQLSTRVMHDVENEMIVIKEGRLNAQSKVENNDHDGPFTILREIYGEKHGKGVLLVIRRNHWLFYLPMVILPAVVVVFRLGTPEIPWLENIIRTLSTMFPYWDLP